MRIAGRRFAPSVFATILLVLGLAAFVRLGLWQLHRAAEKESLVAQYDRGDRSTQRLTAASVAALPAYQHVEARGRYEPERQFLLDNMPSQQGRAGYRVVTPFELDDGGILLVDRGWLPMGTTRDDLPQIAIGSESRTIAGRYDALPRAGIELEAKESAVPRSWPHVVSFPRRQDIESALGRQVLPGLVLLDADQPDGYERAWHARFQFGPERHLAYAVQWFAFALAASVIYLIVSFRRERSVHE